MNKIVFAGCGSNCEKLSRYLEIITDGETVIAVPPYCNYGGKTDGLRALIDQPVMPVKKTVVFADDGEIKHAVRQAEKFLKLKGNDSVLQALGNLLVSYVNFYSGDGKFSPVVELVREDVSKNLSNPAYALDDFIKKLPLNYDYVRKLFQKETGLTPRAYLEGQRMELAANLISSGVTNKYSNYSVSQIAEACGYLEPLYFSRVFKNHFGVSPVLFKQGFHGKH